MDIVGEEGKRENGLMWGIYRCIDVRDMKKDIKKNNNKKTRIR